jgi:large subunit ribosomal protein L1
MGKTKLKIMDDSAPVEEEKKKKARKKEVTKSSEVESVVETETKESQKSVEKVVMDDSASQTKFKNQEKSESSKTKKAKPRSKKYIEISKDLDKSKYYPLTEAVDTVKKLSYSKFNGTLEIHVITAQTGLRGLVSLPFAAGKKIRILAFGKGAETSGADLVGSDEIIEEINKGKVGFDLIVTTPEWMPRLAKAARILGPKGLMPNPKNGTIVSGEDGLKKAVEGFQSGKTEYKTESKSPVIHLGLGKLDQPTEELSSNIKTLLQTIGKTKVKKITLSPTMGPSVKLDLSTI